MLIVRTITELKKLITSLKKEGKSVGFVPTMGYLHEGHLSLVERAKKQDDIIVMSIFVNPLQFGPNEDFDRYPRDIERDEKLARSVNVDIIFYPDRKEMYPEEMTCTVTVHQGVQALCGKSRPGHFDGVATVVLKLFNIVQPSRAYFGMKDAQQVAVIENMIKDFNVTVEIVKCETLREPSGLAKSSRNVYLSEQEKEEAKEIYASLRKAKQAIENGETNPTLLRQLIVDHLESKTSGKVDYVELLAYPNLIELNKIEKNIIIAIALKFTNARLIDNITLEV